MKLADVARAAVLLPLYFLVAPFVLPVVGVQRLRCRRLGHVFEALSVDGKLTACTRCWKTAKADPALGAVVRDAWNAPGNTVAAPRDGEAKVAK